MSLRQPRRIFVRQKRKSPEGGRPLAAALAACVALLGLAGVGVWQLIDRSDEAGFQSHLQQVPPALQAAERHAPARP